MKTLLRVRYSRSRRNSPNFWNWPPKHIPDQKKHVAFRKSLNHSTLLYSMFSIKIRKVQIFSNIFHTYNEYEVLYSILLQSNQQDLKNQIFIVVIEITRSWAHATTVVPIWQCFKANCRLTYYRNLLCQNFFLKQS